MTESRPRRPSSVVPPADDADASAAGGVGVDSDDEAALREGGRMSVGQVTDSATSSPVVDPEPEPAPLALAPAIPRPRVRVRIIRSEQSVPVGGAHYTLRAGQIMTVEAVVADYFINSRLAIAEV